MTAAPPPTSPPQPLLGSRSGQQFDEQRFHPGPDLVADRADGLGAVVGLRPQLLAAAQAGCQAMAQKPSWLKVPL